jgi:LytS/YehU family sensor histidine kinase
MANFFSSLFGTKEEIDITKLQLAAELSVCSSVVDKQLLAAACDSTQLGSIQEYLSQVTTVDTSTFLKISHEIQNLESYINATKVIQNSLFQVNFLNNIDANFNFEIAPFLLFPLVQNAIHLGYNSMEKYPMRVKLNNVGSKIKLEVSNRVNHHIQDQESSAIITNLKSRLSLLYPDRHELLINSNSMLFKATLIIG